MGGDGGSIPKRGDVVKTAGYKFIRNLGGMGYTPNTQIIENDGKFGKNEARNLRWSRCSISEEPLCKPIAACKLGQLYNKEKVLSHLLNKTMPSHAAHIKSLKDIKELKNVKINPNSGHIICPISLTEFEGAIKGFIIWSCGCVISEKALKNINEKTFVNDQDPPKDMICINCGLHYKKTDLISLLPDPQELPDILKELKKSKDNSVSTSIRAKRKIYSKEDIDITRKRIHA